MRTRDARASAGPFSAELTFRFRQCLIPVVMSGIIAVYSLVVSVLIAEDLAPPSTQSYALFTFVRPLLRYSAPNLICFRAGASCILHAASLSA